MSITALLLTLALIGVVCYLITLIPMDGRIRNVIYVIVAIITVLFTLQWLGVDTSPFPRLRL